jgi:hypothetical protein
MKKLTFSSDFLAMNKLFDEIRQRSFDIMLWQGTENKRNMYLLKIEKCMFDHKVLWFKSTVVLNLLKQGPCYMYCEYRKILTKIKIKEVQDHLICTTYPTELILIESAKSANINANFNSDKKITPNLLEILKSADQFNFSNDESHLKENSQLVWGVTWNDFVLISTRNSTDDYTFAKCPLIDFSSGGASFLYHNKDYFVLGDDVTIILSSKGNQKCKGKVSGIHDFNLEESQYRISVRF